MKESSLGGSLLACLMQGVQLSWFKLKARSIGLLQRAKSVAMTTSPLTLPYSII